MGRKELNDAKAGTELVDGQSKQAVSRALSLKHK